MDWNNYVALAMRTNKPMSRKDGQMHALTMLMSEYGETADLIKKIAVDGIVVTRNEYVKEIGDMLWCLAKLCYVDNLCLPIAELDDFQTVCEDFAIEDLYGVGNVCVRYNAFVLLATRIGQIGSMYQHGLQDGSMDTEKLVVLLFNALTEIGIMCGADGITLSECADKNIEKLKKRYPQGFSEERSRNRHNDEVGG